MTRAPLPIQFQRRKGISLIETLLAMSISVLLLILISDLFIQTRHTYRLQNNTAQLDTGSEAILSRMNTVIRQGVSIEQTAGGYTASSTAIIVKLATVNPAGTILPATYDYIIYQRSPNNSTELQEITVADTNSRRTSQTRTITTHLKTLAFNYSDANGTTLASTAVSTTKKVTVTLATSEKSYGDTADTSRTEQIILRNK